MDHKPNSMLSSLAQIRDLIPLLNDAVITLDRANIVRLSSNIQYCLADLTEQAIPDGYSVDIHPLNH